MESFKSKTDKLILLLLISFYLIHIGICTEQVKNFDNSIDEPRNAIQWNYDTDESKLYESQIEEQIFLQNTKLLNASIENNEIYSMCTFYLDNSKQIIEVLPIAKNGNSLFDAIAHQLYLPKINSDEHNNLSFRLRQETVNYIKENFPSFEHDVRGRIYEMNIRDPANYYDWFLNNYLSKNYSSGGTESLRAIGAIYKTNIIVFNENGDLYFANKFNPNYQRSIMLAFRLMDGLNDDKIYTNIYRNHYDSIAEVNQNIINICSKYLAQSYLRSTNNLDGLIIDLD